MFKQYKKIGAAVFVAAAAVAGNGAVLAGGLLDIGFEEATFSDPLVLDNPYWPLNPDGVERVFTYIAETEDECVIDRITANHNFYGGTHALSGAAPYAGLTALQVVDIEWVFEEFDECDTDLLLDADADEAIAEFTFDWYLQDDQQNIWYVGELSQIFGEGDCGSYPAPGINQGNHPECFEGSWEAGVESGEGEEAVVGEAGIVVPGDFPRPGEALENGNYFMQEVAFEAEDMAKILKQHGALSVDDGIEPGDYDDCRKTKEWTALDPGGSVEHKWYCADGPGLVLVEGLSGGSTELEVLVEVSPDLP